MRRSRIAASRRRQGRLRRRTPVRAISGGTLRLITLTRLGRALAEPQPW